MKTRTDFRTWNHFVTMMDKLYEQDREKWLEVLKQFVEIVERMKI